MKKVLAFIFILVLVVFGWRYRFQIQKYAHKLPELVQSPIFEEIKEDISTPPPLIGSLFEQETFLTVNGVLFWTNQNRSQNGNLPALQTNSKLNVAAQNKLKDMFVQQYFEHDSPQGKAAADLAKEAGYDYISIGENLALGNFEDDEALVKAWMDSPGHRANILNPKYTEIGVAVGKGTYKGKKVWMAVQEFGRPASSCPTVNSNIKTQINFLQAEVDSLAAELSVKKQELDSSDPKTKAEYEEYNRKVSEYNNLVKIYNNKVDVLGSLKQEYNSQVRAYNACLAS